MDAPGPARNNMDPESQDAGEVNVGTVEGAARATHSPAAPTPTPPSSSSRGYFRKGLAIVGSVNGLATVLSVIFGIAAAAGAFHGNNNTSGREGDAVVTNQPLLPASCTLPDAAYDIRGDGSLLLRQLLNQVDATVTVQLEYAGEGWLGFAFSESSSMVPNTAVIGLPRANTVQKYALTSRSLTGVTPLGSSSQSLTDASIAQRNGITTMFFTKKLVEAGEVSVATGGGENRFLWAVGGDNDLAMHVARGSATIVLAQCLGKAAAAPTSSSSSAATPMAAPASDPVPAAPATSPDEDSAQSPALD